MNGYFIEPDHPSDYDHHIGGSCDVQNAVCPNCDKRYILHLELNTDDPALNLHWMKVSRLPLLYCMRCALSWHDFAYRLVSQHELDVVEAHRGERLWNEWYDEVGVDEFPHRPFGLRQLPSALQELWDKLNANLELAPEENEVVGRLTGRFAPDCVGGYPIVDVINQIGGRSFLQQRLHDPACPFCRKSGISSQMWFLASLYNDQRKQLRFSFPDVQIVFFVCRECQTILVKHSC
jgi:hypothetical protein